MDKITFSGRVTRRFKQAVFVNDYVRVPLSLFPPGFAVNSGDCVQGIAERQTSAEQYVATQIDGDGPDKISAPLSENIVMRSETPPGISKTPVEESTGLYDSIIVSDDDDKEVTGKSRKLLEKLLKNDFSAENNDEEFREEKHATFTVKSDIAVEPKQLDFRTFPLREQRRLKLQISNTSNCLMHTLRAALIRCDSRVHKLLISLTAPSRDGSVCMEKTTASVACVELEKWFSLDAKHRRNKPNAGDHTGNEPKTCMQTWNVQLGEADSVYMAIIMDGECIGELNDAFLQLVFDSGSRNEIVTVPIYACVEIPVKKPQQSSKMESIGGSRKPKLQLGSIPRATPMIKVCLSPTSMDHAKKSSFGFLGRENRSAKSTGGFLHATSPTLAVVPRSFTFREVDKDTRLRELECVVLADETDRISSRPLVVTKAVGAKRTESRRRAEAYEKNEEFGKCLVMPTQRMMLKIPASVLACIRNPTEWKSHLPMLNEPLRAENYKERFQVLLALEMAHVDMRWQNLLVNGVHFAKHSASTTSNNKNNGRCCFSFDAPVLYSASFNPVADMQRRDESVYIYARRTSHHYHAAIVFEGFVDRIEGTRVFGLFDDGFDPNAHDEYTVTFRMRHETLHRMYTAVCYVQSMMKQAFEPILFAPSSLSNVCMMPPQFIPKNLQLFNTNLNDEQRLAVNRICAGQLRPRPLLIYGPPGTGKTMTLVEAALQVAVNVPESKILLCAPSNAAANWLLELLEKFLMLNEPKIEESKSLKILRLQSKSNRNSTGESKFATFLVLQLKNLKNIFSTIEKHQICVATCSAMGWFFQLDESRRMFTHVFVDEAASAVEAECVIPFLMLKMPSYGLFRYAEDGKTVQAVVNKLCANNTGRSSCLGLDSAMPSNSQVPADAEKISYLMPQIVLAGDPKQLGAVTHSDDAAAFAEYNKIADPLQQSLMERLMLWPQYGANGGGAVQSHSIVMLKKNYRSAAAIVELVSELFYDGELVAAGTGTNTGNGNGDSHAGSVVDQHPSASLPSDLSRKYAKAVTMVTHEKPHAKEANWSSLHNMCEVQAAVEIAERLMTTFKVAPESIGIIATYRSQANAIHVALKLKLQKNLHSGEKLKLPMIGTVQEFQGQERDVIILSTVRSQTQRTIETSFGALFGERNRKSAETDEYSVNDEICRLNDAEFDERWISTLNSVKILHPEFEKNMLGFVADSRRFNVAITRARKKLMILGNPFTLSMSPFWYRFMMLIETQNVGSGGASFHGDCRMSDVRSFARYLYAEKSSGLFQSEKAVEKTYLDS